MDTATSTMDIGLVRVVAIAGADGMPTSLPISQGRVGAVLDRRSYRVDLRDHLVFPGLINAHDHLQLNAVPPLPASGCFANSYDWIAAFQSHFKEREVMAALEVSRSLRLRHGALKNLLAGTTCVAQHDGWHAELDAPDFPITVLRDYGWSYALGWPQYGPPVRESFAATAADRPWMIHLAEGTDPVAKAELTRLDELGCLAANTVLIHGVGLSEQDVERVINAGAAVVWCPTSNRNLLRGSLDPRRLNDASRLTLGTDSRLTGARDLLEELRAVVAGELLDARQALQLVTTRAANILHLPAHGNLRPGARADLVIVADGGEQSTSLIGLRRSQIRAVVRGGVPRIADPDFEEWFGVAGIETVRVRLDGKLKLMAKSLADPALLALEPGLEMVDDGSAAAPRPVAVAGSG